MKDVKKNPPKKSASLGLDTCFQALDEQLTHAIDVLDEVKGMKSARKELKKYRLAIAAIQRQVHLHEKDSLLR